MANPTSTYMARVTEHLELLPRAEHLPFIERQIKRWVDLYAAFTRMVDSDKETSATAFDYCETIAALDILKKEKSV